MRCEHVSFLWCCSLSLGKWYTKYHLPFSPLVLCFSLNSDSSSLPIPLPPFPPSLHPHLCPFFLTGNLNSAHLPTRKIADRRENSFQILHCGHTKSVPTVQSGSSSLRMNANELSRMGESVFSFPAPFLPFPKPLCLLLLLLLWPLPCALVLQQAGFTHSPARKAFC